MLESLRVLNYKTHTDSTVPLESVNGFVGDIGAGKTGLIEALTSAVYGRGFPREMLHTSLSGKTESEGEIEVVFTDQRRLLVTRKGAAQKIRLQAADGSVQAYEGAQGLAPIIQEFTGFKEIKETGGSLTLTPQYRALDDPPFGLVHGAPKTIAGALTSLSSAMVYTQAQGVLAREITQSKATESTIRTQVERLEKEHAADVASLDVEEVRRLLENATEADAQRQATEARLTQIREVSRSLRALRIEHREARVEQEVVDTLDSAWELLAEARETARRRTAIENALMEVEAQAAQLKKVEVEIVELERQHEAQKAVVAELRAQAPDLCPTCGRPLEVV